jgi:hypothetical protein
MVKKTISTYCPFKEEVPVTDTTDPEHCLMGNAKRRPPLLPPPPPRPRLHQLKYWQRVEEAAFGVTVPEARPAG